MKPYFQDEWVTLFCGDCRDVLPTLAPARFATVITDPPYHLTQLSRGGSPRKNDPATPHGRTRLGSAGFMGKAWDGGDVAFRPELWADVLRVCKPGAFLLAFGGTRTWHRLACAIEDAGWELRDTIVWMYAQGFPKSLDISKAIDKAAGAEREVVGRSAHSAKRTAGTLATGNDRPSGYNCGDEGERLLTAPATDAGRQWNGWGTALKPAWEPIIVAMKPLDGTFAENAQRHGVAGLNIDGGRIGLNGEPPPTGSGDRRGGVVYAQDKWTRTQMANGGNTTSAVGRWPANVLLDEAAAVMLDEQAGECGGQDKRTNLEPGMRPGGFGNVGHDSGSNVPNARLYGDTGGASRFFYTAKASKSDRGHGNTHPTVKPVSLIRYLCRLTATPTGGEILDPFGGSMTTAVAARAEGRPSLSIELDEGHCRIGAERLAQGVLFSPEPEVAAG